MDIQNILSILTWRTSYKDSEPEFYIFRNLTSLDQNRKPNHKLAKVRSWEPLVSVSSSPLFPVFLFKNKLTLKGNLLYPSTKLNKEHILVREFNDCDNLIEMLEIDGKRVPYQMKSQGKPYTLNDLIGLEHVKHEDIKTYEALIHANKIVKLNKKNKKKVGKIKHNINDLDINKKGNKVLTKRKRSGNNEKKVNYPEKRHKRELQLSQECVPVSLDSDLNVTFPSISSKTTISPTNSSTTTTPITDTCINRIVNTSTTPSSTSNVSIDIDHKTSSLTHPSNLSINTIHSLPTTTHSTSSTSTLTHSISTHSLIFTHNSTHSPIHQIYPIHQMYPTHQIYPIHQMMCSRIGYVGIPSNYSLIDSIDLLPQRKAAITVALNRYWYMREVKTSKGEVKTPFHNLFHATDSIQPIDTKLNTQILSRKNVAIRNETSHLPPSLSASRTKINTFLLKKAFHIQQHITEQALTTQHQHIITLEKTFSLLFDEVRLYCLQKSIPFICIGSLLLVYLGKPIISLESFINGEIKSIEDNSDVDPGNDSTHDKDTCASKGTLNISNLIDRVNEDNQMSIKLFKQVVLSIATYKEQASLPNDLPIEDNAIDMNRVDLNGLMYIFEHYNISTYIDSYTNLLLFMPHRHVKTTQTKSTINTTQWVDQFSSIFNNQTYFFLTSTLKTNIASKTISSPPFTSETNSITSSFGQHILKQIYNVYHFYNKSC